jgi:GTP cyclohydrolase II
MVAFADANGHPIDDVALVCGDVLGGEAIETRIHSECLTGDVFGSIRCDCRDQLEIAMARVVESKSGVILYLRQEGRGIGIANKVKAYALQDTGLDTIQANLHLGFDEDLRNYDVAAGMLHALGVRSIVLHTNNPAKIQGLEAGGVRIERRAPIVVAPQESNRHYLATKFAKMGHLPQE